MSLRSLLALVIIFTFLSGCNAVGAAAAQAPHADLPANLSAALTVEYGQYDDIVTWDTLMNDLQTADVVCIGEAHYDARDMATAFEMARVLSGKTKIALAVERFARDLQPALERLNLLDTPEQREAGMETVLKDREYQTVWGVETFSQSGYPTNTPSQPIFETMMQWAARERVPVIALDVTLEERKKGLGENLPSRNAMWKNGVENFLANNPGDKYLVVAIGGINHMDNAPASFPSQIKNSIRKVISLGQRDAMYQFRSSMQVQTLAQENRISDFVVHHPTQAITNGRGVPMFSAPPDYWIAVHAPEQIQQLQNP